MTDVTAMTQVLPTLAVQSMTDDELHAAERDFAIVAGTFSKIASLCLQRAKSIRSVISRRSNAADRGQPMAILPARQGRGAADLVRPEGEAVTFSDHAILRYLERIKGIDLEATRREMALMYDRGNVLAGGGIVVTDGHCFIRSKQGFVKTMMPLAWLNQDDIELAANTYAR